jgi:chromosome segregation ATPase
MAALPLEIEQTIRAEITPLAERFTNTRELYREVCVLLFFRHGITPTANLLYQLVRRGTMSTPAQALQSFWGNLREKSRQRISHPDLPSELHDVTGALAAAVWDKANTLAAQNLEAFKADAQTAAEDASRQVVAITGELEASRGEVVRAKEAIAERDQRVSEAEKSLSAAHATIASLERQLSEQASLMKVANAELERARKDFSEELDKMRRDLALAEERLSRDHARMLKEIDSERQVTTGLRDELEAARTHNRQSDESWRTALEKAHRALGDMREKSGALEGKLHAAEASLTKVEADLDLHRRENMSLKLELGHKVAHTPQPSEAAAHSPHEGAPAKATVRRKKPVSA